MDKELLIRELKDKIKYYNKEIKQRTQSYDDIKFTEIVTYFKGQRDAYKSMLVMIESNAPRL